MNTKGQELSLTTIILAALGMIILVVLVMIFTGQTGKLNIGITDVQTNAQCNQACRANPAYASGKFVAADQCVGAGQVAEYSVRGPEGAPLCCCTEKVTAP